IRDRTVTGVQTCALPICVVALLFGPVIHPLEMVLRLFERAVALVDAERVSEIKAPVAVDVERWHAAGFRSAGVQAGQAGVSSRSGSNTVRLHADPVPIGPEAKIGNEGGADGVGVSQGKALVARERRARKIEPRESRAARLLAKSARSVFREIADRVASKDAGLFRQVVVEAAVVLVVAEDFDAGRDVVVDDIGAGI